LVWCLWNCSFALRYVFDIKRYACDNQVMANQLELPENAQALVKVDSLTPETWDLIKHAIRPEYRGTYLGKAQVAIQVDLNDAAVAYFWGTVEAALRNKVLAYGIEYFGSAVNKPDLRTQEDLREEVKAHELIDGCFALGIIGAEAHFFLHHCRETRNKFSMAHEALGELDRLETFNFIKNCVKYCLCFEPPAPGFSVRDLIQSLSAGSVAPEEAVALIQAQSSRIYGPLLHSFFSQWIEPACPAQLKAAIKEIAPQLWKWCTDDVRSSVAQRFASLRDRTSADASREAQRFLKIVDGIRYIPRTLRFAMFNYYARNLIDAYSGWENFYNEPEHSRALRELGLDVPPETSVVYAKAVVLSFVGNCYGRAFGAESYNREMLDGASASVVNAIFNVLQRDPLVAATLQYDKPAARLKELMELLREKTLTSQQRKIMEFVVSSPTTQIQRHFETIHSSLSQQLAA